MNGKGPRIVKAETGPESEVHYAEYMPEAKVPGELFIPIEVSGMWGDVTWSRIELVCMN